MSNSDTQTSPIVPTEGWHVIHLFYQIDHTQWSLLSEEEQLKAKTDLSILIQEIRSAPKTQLLSFSIVTPKADIGFMLLTDDLHLANTFEKQLTLALGPDILTPSFSYLSMTETGDYMTTEEEYSDNTLKSDRKLTEGSEEYETALNDFKSHMAKYSNDKLYPNMPDWPVFCFYSMAKRRGESFNWYALPFEERKRLMAEHGKVGRQWAGKIRQRITG
ncbi:MAG: heme peroxidase, partial [Akkermansiaceae bacterium]|nr:heme peroxidase [Akkermansiaceae bacterium]